MGGGPDEERQSAAVAKCVSDIESADFVALDFEFSGLFLQTERDKRILSIEDLYDKCAESIPEFLALQLGLSCARRRQEDGIWELRSHEFNLWPQERRIFTADLQSLRFLRAHGFDFNAYFASAYKYARVPPADTDQAASMRRLPPTHATRVVAALRKSRVPLIFHNGMLDLVHFYDKFVGVLPDESKEFCEAWTAQFPLLFDTRFIAQEGRFQVLRQVGGLSLGDLHRHLSSLPDVPVKFERAGPLGAGTAAHGSSGFDAIMTAEVFVMEMDMWLRHAASGGNKRRRQAAPNTGADSAKEAPAAAAVEGAPAAESASAAAVPASAPPPAEPDDGGGWTVVSRKRPLDGAAASGAAASGLVSPSLLESHDVCRKFHNKIAVMGAAPPVMDLGRPPGLQIAPGPPPPPASAGPSPPGQAASDGGGGGGALA
mmetsp:Transcript_7526/g.23924  ORF Transcript_7526/g.23924 Transcript_7526/m.23924 type:complete len:430 (+) Transcript_7526:96-1385(+)